MRRQSIIRVLAPGLAAVALAFTAAVPAGAKVAQAAPTGFARAGHFAPGRGPVDLLVDGKVAAKGLTYKHVTGYLPVPAGTHSFTLRTLAGKNVLDVQAGIPANGAVTIGAVSTRTGLAGNVFDDRLQMPAAGTALVRFIHTAPAASTVDISTARAGILARGLKYPEATAYRSVPAGTYDLVVRSTATKKQILRINGWNAASGSQSSIVLVKTPSGQIDAVPFIDSAGTATAPQGGSQTGLGGTAVDPAHHDGWVTTRSVTLLAVLLVVATAMAGGFVHRRRRIG